METSCSLSGEMKLIILIQSRRQVCFLASHGTLMHESSQPEYISTYRAEAPLWFTLQVVNRLVCITEFKGQKGEEVVQAIEEHVPAR